MRMYVIRDLVAEESGPIFEAKNDQVARRGFKQALEKSRGGIGEYKLLCIGEYDHNADFLNITPIYEVINSQGDNDE